MLDLSKIRIDGGTQIRVEPSQETIDRYAALYIDGYEFPPITVFFDGVDYWLTDGFHRYFAAKKAGESKINETIINGTNRDAILFSVGANGTHGLNRTNADKRNAVETMLKDAEWSQWSDNAIAKQCHVSQPFVGMVRKSLITVISDDKKNNQERTYKNKNGDTSTMQVANIGKSKKDYLRENEDSNNQENNKEKEQIQQELYSDADIDPAAELEAAHKEIERLTQIIESDDQLAEANKEIKRLSSLCETQQFRINSLMSEKAEAVRYAKLYKSKLEKLEKQVSKSDLVDF